MTLLSKKFEKKVLVNEKIERKRASAVTAKSTNELKTVPTNNEKVLQREREKKDKEWAARMEKKAKDQKMKALSHQLKAELKQEEERARSARIANRQRKRDNERRSMVTQDIKNVKAIKKLTLKQRRKARIVLKHEL